MRGQIMKAVRVFEAQNLRFRHAEAPHFCQRQINAAALGVCPHVAENVGQLQRLAERVGIFTARGILVAEDLDTEQPDHGGDAVAVAFEILEGFVSFDVEVHLHAANQLIEQVEGQVVASDDGLQLLIDAELRTRTLASAGNVCAPRSQLRAARLDRD